MHVLSLENIMATETTGEAISLEYVLSQGKPFCISNPWLCSTVIVIFTTGTQRQKGERKHRRISLDSLNGLLGRIKPDKSLG